jgi:hypothetical protein
MQDNAGNFIIGGYVSGIGSGGLDAPMMKLDGNGDTIWSRNYGGAGDDWFYHILQTPDNGYLGAGFTKSFGQGGKDIYLVKIDYNGNLLWSKTYGTAQDESAFGHSVQLTDDGGFIITGSGSNAGQGIFLMKTDSSGMVQWAKSYDGAWGHAVKQTPDHGFLICGSILIGSFNDVVLIKTDSIGNVQWSKTYGGSAQSESGWLLDLADDGGYVLGGWTKSFTGSEDMYFIKTDAGGNSGCNEASSVITSGVYPMITANVGTLVTIGVNTISYPVNLRRQTTITNLCSTVGMGENKNVDQIRIYPNPAKNHLTVQSSEELGLITIYNFLGEIVLCQKANSIQQQLDISSLPAGIYLVQIRDEIIRFIKE